jgi:hypothetical protein
LLDANGAIPDENFASSSIFMNNRFWRASEGRLNHIHILNKGSGAWCASSDDNKPWLSVKFLETAQVTRIAIQGSPKIYTKLTKKYKISYSMDGKNWILYQENEKEHVSN